MKDITLKKNWLSYFKAQISAGLKKGTSKILVSVTDVVTVSAKAW